MNAQNRFTRCLPVLAVLVAGLAGCQRSPSGPSAESLYTTATVKRGTMADVVQLGGQVVSPQSQTLTFGRFGGRVLEVLVQPGQAVRQGEVLLRVDTSAQERELREAEADLKVAQAELAVAERTASTAEVAKAEADLALAEAKAAQAELALRLVRDTGVAFLEQTVVDGQVKVQKAKDQLRLAELGSNASTIRTLEYQFTFFQRVLRDQKKETERAKTQETITNLERELLGLRAARNDALRQARDEVTKAEEELAAAEAALARAKARSDDPTVEARLNYEKAAVEVTKAKKALDDLRAGADSAAVKAARTVHEAAVARVDTAKAAIAEATLTAPFDGVVFGVFVEPDQEVLANGEAAYVADPSDLRIQAQATEMDITRLAVDQAVRVTFEGYPGRLFSGKVLSLPPRGQDMGGMSFFQIETSLEREDADIRPGMFANVRIVIGERSDVLLVPAAAVQYRPLDQTYVTVRTAEGKTQERKVKIGLNDGIMVEVQEGLSEGETVIVPLLPPTDPMRRGYPMGPMGPMG